MNVVYPISRSRFLSSLLFFAVAAGCVTRSGDMAQTSAPTVRAGTKARAPFFNARLRMSEYAGPGREVSPPVDLEEIKIGWYGPADADHAEAGIMWLAATLAIEDANRLGGYRGIPFRLMTSWSENPWGTGVRGVARLVYAHDVWAMAGAPTGPSAHLVEQIVAKARLPFLSPVSTDKTTNLANVPWTFSCAPGDHLQAPVLARALLERVDGRRFALVSCTDHDSRVFATELLAALDKLKAFPSLRLEFRPDSLDFDTQLQGLQHARPAAIALIAGPLEAARLLIAMRESGLTMPVFGGPAMGRRLFVERGRPAAEGVVFPLLWYPSSAGQRSAGFARRFCERFGVEPDYTAAYTYDAMTLLVTAIHKAGLNRVRIRDALRLLSPWPGVTGLITWDPTGQNHRPIQLGTIRDGRIVPR